MQGIDVLSLAICETSLTTFIFDERKNVSDTNFRNAFRTNRRKKKSYRSFVFYI